MLRQVRDKFLDFFESKQHKKIESFSIIPEQDATLLFINAGMAPLKKFFMQEAKPLSKRITNSQHCLRVGGKHNDLADVGYTKRHHTFFEMLGNFSFGDYFQEEAIANAWEFLTEILKIDKTRLYVTVHPKDTNAKKLWLKFIDEDCIYELEENVWSMGEIGPFGYCSEIFYDLNPVDNKIDLEDGDRFLEIWNLVFMQFYSNGKDKSLLPAPCIDAGMGLERIVSVLENVADTYEISFFKKVLPILNLKEQDVDSKIFLDHLRSVAFIISQGIMPEASNRGYILRRLIRRALKSFFTFQNLDFKKVIYDILNIWQQEYDFVFNVGNIYSVLLQEKQQFEQVLEIGMVKFEEFFEKNKNLTAQELFILHDTYGFSIDIVVDLLKERKISCNLEEFEQIMQEHKQKNREKSLNITLPYDETIFEDNYEVSSNIIGFYEDYVILDRTPFYAQAGGQIGDNGYITGSDFSLKITDTRRIGKVIVHKFQEEKGKAKLGKVVAKIDKANRAQIAAHHSSTHLLQAAICKFFQADIKQMGSFVSDQKLRLDFNYQKTITPEELVEIETIVNDWIQENIQAKIEHMNYQEAVDQGAKAFFTYDEEVRTVKMGDCSFELCCGSHVKALGDIGVFKILKASSISAGVKRIEACACKTAVKHMQKNASILKNITEFLSCDQEHILQKLKSKAKQPLSLDIQQKEVKGYKVGFCIAQDIEIEKQMQQFKLDILLVAIDKGAKLGLQLKLGSSVKNIDAKQVMQEIGALINAKGCGGRKNYAQTGGDNIKDQNILFEKLIEQIK